jgi:hypothetical protein
MMNVDDEKDQNDVLKIMSFNVYNHGCIAYGRTARAMIDMSGCDIVCTQEEPSEAEDTQYYTRLPTCGEGNERVGVYYKKDLESVPTVVECIETIPPPPLNEELPRRYAIIFEYKGIRIANLHLEGGGYADHELCRGNKTKIYKYKMELLRQVMRRDPDIIMGDFNSVYSSNEEQLQHFLSGQETYFHGRCPGKVEPRFINTWNGHPFIELKERYTYAKPTNEGETYTSALGKSIVDTIWYKTGTRKFTFLESIIKPIVDDPFDRRNCSYSDHNPVLLAIKLTSGGGRRLRRRTVHKQRRSHRKRKTQRKNRR